MPSDLEARILHPRRGRFGRGAETAGIYLLIALALLAELSLVALHPEKDAVLHIGIILLTIAVAIWLRFVFLVPAVIALWLVPPSIRDAVLGNEDLTWGHAAALAGQLYLACASRLAYTALRSRLLPGSAVALAPPYLLAAETPRNQPEIAAPHPETPAQTPAEIREKEPSRPPLPCGCVLRWSDATAFVERLAGLSIELHETSKAIRPTLENCRILELDYSDQAAYR